LLIHDTEGHILDCNGAACRRLGYTRKELLALLTSDIEAPKFAQGFAQRCARQLSNLAYVCEGEHVTKDGRRIPVEINTRVITYLGVPALLAAVRDITERKRVEAELEQMREAADSANAAKSEFLANMSHEIRTPMNGILGMTELALGTQLSGEQREYLQMVKASTDSLLTVINDILDFSKIEAGRLLIEPIEFHLRDSLAEMMRTLAFRANEKGLALAYRVPPDVPDDILGDSGRIQQVILNLVGNAIKFTVRGEILVSVSVDLRNGDDAVLHFAVADTGIGIPPDQISSIFEPFKQAIAPLLANTEARVLVWLFRRNLRG
jgi:PAS domain S-box-containing protein